MLRKGVATATAVLLGVLCLRGPFPLRADGDLQGQQLRPATDLQTGIETLLGGLIDRRPPAGRIDSVVVTEDAPGRLTVSVTCSGDLDGRRVRGELLSRERRVQRQIQSAPARLEGAAREVELSFAPTDGGGDDVLADSTFLRVSVDGGGPGLTRVFKLGKAWNAGSGTSGTGGSSQGAAVVRVKARPEPRAAALPSVEPTPAPPAHVRPEVRDHRGEARPGIVRDHRGGARGGIIRDHRGGRQPAEVRDHRRAAAPADAATPAPPPSARQRQVVLTQTASVVRALPQTGRTLTLDPNALVLSAADQQKGARGPNVTDQHDLLADVLTDVPLEASQVASIRPAVFRDQDPATGYFYFLPQTYHLGWLADKNRYDMAMLYLAATTPGSAGEVSMAAGLTAGIDADEIRVAKDLLAAYCRTHACPAAPELRPFPIDAGRVAVSLSGTLRLFNIPAEKVAPVGLSSALGDFQLAWVTDPVTKENVQLVLEESGINGNVTFALPGAEGSAQLVDVQIKLADPGSFARPRWRRNEAWRNPTPYPVRVKYLHALVAGAGAAPTVYSWNLGGAMVAPGGRVECDASAVPQWIDRKASRLWIEYAVAEDCASCTQQVLKSITGGVTSVAASQITFHTMNPLAEMGAYELALRVRSKRFDPDGKDTKEKSVVLKADNEDFTLGPIYAVETEAAGSSDVLFEYFMTVAMADGTEHEARQWMPSRDLRVLVGRSQIEKALGFVPGGPPPAGPTPAPTPVPEPSPEQ